MHRPLILAAALALAGCASNPSSDRLGAMFQRMQAAGAASDAQLDRDFPTRRAGPVNCRIVQVTPTVSRADCN